MLISIYADNVSFGNMNEYLMQTNIIEFEEIGEFSEKIALSNEIDPDTTKEEDLSALREDVEIEDITGLDNEISQHLVIVDEFEDNVDIVNSEIDIDNSLDLESLVIAVDNRTFIKPYEEDKDKLQPAEDEETEQYVDTNDQDDNIIEDYDNEKDNEIITLSTEELTNILDDVIGSDETNRYTDISEVDAYEKRDTKQEEDVEYNTQKDLHDEIENTITIEIPDGIKDKLPEDFDLYSLRAIDLREAERIANEDIRFLAEEDIVDALDELDIAQSENLENSEKKKEINVTVDVEGEKSDAPMPASETFTDDIDDGKADELMTASDTLTDDNREKKTSDDLNQFDAQNVEEHCEISANKDMDEIEGQAEEKSIETIVHINEESTNSMEKEDKISDNSFNNDDDILDIFVKEEQKITDDLNEDVKEAGIDNKGEIDDNIKEASLEPDPELRSREEEGEAIIIIDQLGKITHLNTHSETLFDYKTKEAAGVELIQLFAQQYREKYKQVIADIVKEEDKSSIDDIYRIIAVKKDGTEFPIELSLSGAIINGEWHILGIVNENTGIEFDNESDFFKADVLNKDRLEKGDIIPEEYINIGKEDNNVFIIDDNAIVEDDRQEELIFDDELEKLAFGINDVIEGKAIILQEQSLGEYQKLQPLFDRYSSFTESVSFKEKKKHIYIEDSIDFVDNTFIDSFDDEYIKDIDKEHKEITKSTSSLRLELSGLSNEEMATIEDSIWGNEFKEVDLDIVPIIAKPDIDQTVVDYYIINDINHIIAMDNSIIEDERRSIEEDLLASSALIFEENIKEIKARYDNLKAAKTSQELQDISDFITIIEEEIDPDKIVNNNQIKDMKDVKKLLKYLDQIMEDLPDDVIKNFADSEYFDLYIKVLNEPDA
ncbi:MAG: PAS domain S-box protein [Spirochaetota bacterium]|nr:PAS domain S-box protein [Spirochaetota bacterium]